MSEVKSVSVEMYLSEKKKFVINKVDDGTFFLFRNGFDESIVIANIEDLEELSEIIDLCAIDQRKGDEDDIPF